MEIIQIPLETPWLLHGELPSTNHLAFCKMGFKVPLYPSEQS